jgi:hypothetical protein
MCRSSTSGGSPGSSGFGCLICSRAWTDSPSRWPSPSPFYRPSHSPARC